MKGNEAILALGLLLAACGPEVEPASDPAPSPLVEAAAPSAPAPTTEPASTPSSTPVAVEQPVDPLSDLAAWDAATSLQRQEAAERVAEAEDGFAFARLETFSCGGQTHEVAIFDHEATGMEFVLIPAGEAVLGGAAETRGSRRVQSAPAHDRGTVTFRHPFLIARTEVTWRAWQRVLGPVDASKFDSARHPVGTEAYDEMVRFCELTGLTLPSEARWEYACRAGTTTAYCFGDDSSRLDAWAWTFADPRAVAQLEPNAFGLFDMHGNVSEVCADHFRPAGAPPRETADTSGPPFFRVTRGGHTNYSDVTSSARGGHARNPARGPPDWNLTGFRPCRVLPRPE